MLYEFVLDPELVATWHDRKKYSFFDEKFTLRSRRAVSVRFPNKWKSQVLKAFNSSPASQDQNAIRNLDALLSELNNLW